VATIQHNIDTVVRVFAYAPKQMVGYFDRKPIVRILVMSAVYRYLCGGGNAHHNEGGG
jgi:hypothetical protein